MQMSHARSSTSICREMKPALLLLLSRSRRSDRILRTFSVRPLPSTHWTTKNYQKIQQKLIDALDKADYVEITGRDGNETSMKVQLHTLTDP